MYIYKVGVVGAGLMGSGIAQVVSYAGIPVVLKDVNDGFVQKGLANARAVYEGRVKKGKMSAEELEAKMALIQGTTSYDDFKDVDLVIEAVPETPEMKRAVFRELDGACPAHAILSTNTSALSISAMAAATKRPGQVAGLHFFYPASAMKLVEVIPALQTATETVDALVTFAEGLRKIPVRVRECAGFLVNRLLMPYLNEACLALQEGAAEALTIDEACVAFGMPLGPFILADSLGVDICRHVAETLFRAYGERAKPALLIEWLFAQRLYGAKAGAGFYVYDGRTPEPLPGLIAEIQKATGVKGTPFSIERILYPMANEAAFCLEENVASPGDIDIAMMAGTGWPQATGGLLRWADSVGLDKILVALDGFHKTLGGRFLPSPMLRRMVDAGWTGKSAGRGFFPYA